MGPTSLPVCEFTLAAKALGVCVVVVPTIDIIVKMLCKSIAPRQIGKHCAESHGDGYNSKSYREPLTTV